MPSIHIRRAHQLSIAEARARVEQVAARMHEKFGLAGEWQGMLLAPLTGMIEQEIRRKLEELFA